MKCINRRRLLLACSASAAFLPVRAFATARLLTPPATEGPFYPDLLPLDTDNDLVTIAPGAEPASGEIFHLYGRVTDLSGKPKTAHRIEIWQCDANGVYRHSGDTGRGTFDPRFQGFGIATTARDGGYRFRTIALVSYPGRTPHIHFKVKSPNGPVFTSQLYLSGHPQNESDFLFGRLGSDAAKQAASVRLTAAPELDPGAVKGIFDIVLG